MSEMEESGAPETNPEAAEADLEQAVDAATESVAVQASQLEELAPGTAAGENVELSKLMDVPVQVTVQVGRTSINLGELVGLGPGSLLELDREAHEPADILVNGKIVARGEIVTIDQNYGVRITNVES
jgi:flagellar motor switch protein FliN/FliY